MKTLSAFIAGSLWTIMFAVPSSVTNGWALKAGLDTTSASLFLMVGVIATTLYAVIGD